MKNRLTSFLKNIYKKELDNKIISLVIIGVIFYALYYYFSNNSSTITTYQYTAVKRGPITSIVSGTGQVIPNSQVDLKPKVNANVIGVYVKSGDRVKSGQVLFKLDATDAYKQLRDAKTALQSAQLALEKLKNPQPIQVMNVNNSIKQAEDAKKNEDLKVATAYQNLLNSNLQVIPSGSYTNETAPTLSGSYLKNDEGELKIDVYQGGVSGYSFSVSGLSSCIGNINTIVPQPICDTGLYIKWNSSIPQTGWLIDIPNKQSSSYLSNYTSWQTAISSRDINNAESDRTIASLKQQLLDLTPGDDNIDVKSALLNVELKKNALIDAENNLANYVITAPFDGVMASVSVDIGSSAVMASSNSSSALGTIVTDKQLAQLTLNETDIAKVKIGEKASVSVDALDGISLNGNVVEITTLGTVTSGVVTYKVKVAFDPKEEVILPNMSVSVDITTDSKDDVLYLPNQAVKKDNGGYYVEENPDISKTNITTSTTSFASSTEFASSTQRRGSNGYGSSSYKRGSNNTTTSSQTLVILTRIPITIGIQSDTLTEIIGGLNEGDKVVLKKITTNTLNNSSVPSITSLFKPKNISTNRTSGDNNFRGQ